MSNAKIWSKTYENGTELIFGSRPDDGLQIMIDNDWNGTGWSAQLTPEEFEGLFHKMWVSLYPARNGPCHCPNQAVIHGVLHPCAQWTGHTKFKIPCGCNCGNTWLYGLDSSPIHLPHQSLHLSEFGFVEVIKALNTPHDCAEHFCAKMLKGKCFNYNPEG